MTSHISVLFLVFCTYIPTFLTPFFRVSITTDSLKGEEILSNISGQLQTVQGTERHTVALSWSHFKTIIYPFLCEQVTYNHFVSFLKNPQQRLPAIKCALNRSIIEPDDWLRLALVSNNIVCFLQFQMTDREMGTINTFYLFTHALSFSLSIPPRLLLWFNHEIYLFPIEQCRFSIYQSYDYVSYFNRHKKKKIIHVDGHFVLLLYPCTLSNLTTGTDLCMNVFFCLTILIFQQEHLGPSEMSLWSIYRHVSLTK